jgi:steroid 5-alpha reductase family enzyme
MKAFLIIFGLAAGLTWAGSQGGELYRGLPAFALCAALIFLLQWLAFVPAYAKQTEKFYDLVGSLTYITAIAFTGLMSAELGMGSMLIMLCVLMWAARLGSFLFRRIREDGADSRFDKIKPSSLLFFRTWNIQGLWVLVTGGAALAALTSPGGDTLTVWSVAGFFLWLLGFVWEVIADNQKRSFRRKNGSESFITSGLWAFSRHPNYFGEILLWTGIAVMAVPALNGWQYLTLVSPVFVFVLLTRVSGIPLLERKAKKRWGDNPKYQDYLANTPVLVPRMQRSGER